MLKTNGTERIDESADVCLHFSGHVTYLVRPLEEYLVFILIRTAHTSFSPFTLGSTTTNRHGFRTSILKLSQVVINC